MGRAEDALQHEFPPQSGGGSSSQNGPRCREETGCPWGEMVVVVVVVVVETYNLFNSNS